MSSDYRELLAEFNAHKVEYLVVGAHALAAHGRIRATKDLDVWVRPSAENAPRVMAALRAFGAPLFDLDVRDLETLSTSSHPATCRTVCIAPRPSRSPARASSWRSAGAVCSTG